MNNPKLVLEEARKAAPRTDLSEYTEAIRTLRKKNWTWRDIAEFLQERGVETDHTRLIRFMQKQEARWQVPSADDYYAALKSLRSAGKISVGPWAMLCHLYLAHNRTATYTQLAEAAAVAGVDVPRSRPHTYANREFGGLGKLLGQTVGMEFLPSSRRDAPFYSSAIGVGSSTTPDGSEFEIVMHHEVAKALDRFRAEGKPMSEGLEARRSHE